MPSIQVRLGCCFVPTHHFLPHEWYLRPQRPPSGAHKNVKRLFERPAFLLQSRLRGLVILLPCNTAVQLRLRAGSMVRLT